MMHCFSRNRPSLFLWGALLLAGLILPEAAFGQATDASISGSVLNPSGEPLAGAEVEIRNLSTGFRANLVTSRAGEFSFNQLPLGGPYIVRASFLGYRPEEDSGIQLNLGTRARLEFRLVQEALSLEGVLVEAPRTSTFERFGAATRVGEEQLENLPVADRRFENLASLSPLVGRNLTIAGARPMSTDVRIDGVGGQMNNTGQTFAGPFTMTIEAIREFEIVTNEYDVTKGRQGGGMINAVTKSGTNDFTGSTFLYHRNNRLTTEDFRGVQPADFSLTQWGGSLGGPILKDRMHFFTAFDQQLEDRPFFVLDLRTEQDEIDQQISRANLLRMQDILERKYGLPTGVQHFGEFSRAPVNTNWFGRLDWQLNPLHRLTLRHNYTFADDNQGVGADQARHFSESRGDVKIGSNGTLLSLRSNLSPSILNEFKFQHLAFTRERIPNLNIPRAFVRVQSPLPNGTTGNVQVQFGGNRLAPENYIERQLQLANTTYLQRGETSFSFGTDNILTYIDRYLSAEQGGLFEFNSLDDLEAMRPARYSRQVPILSDEPHARFYVLDLAMFGQVERRLMPGVSAFAGLRFDATNFLTPAPRNDILFNALGVASDRAPSDWSLSPRIQLTWDRRQDGTEVIRVGGGRFTSQPPYNTHVNHLLQSGLEAVEIIQVGNQVPEPKFSDYRQDRGTIPGVPAGFDPRSIPSYINVIGEKFDAPSTWKASTSYQRTVGTLSFGLSAFYARTANNFQYYDINRVEQPFFRIEGGRGVYVPAATIPVNSGRTNVNDSRVATEVGRVLELAGDTRLDQRTLVAQGSWAMPWGGQIDGSYTWNRTYDNSSFNCCIARTSVFTPIKDDPRDLTTSWGPSDFDFPHKVVMSAIGPEFWGFRFSARYVGQTGRPISAVINGDVNGDDIANNDLAFVFDPNSPETPEALRAGMRKVLDNPDNRFRSYLLDNLGQIASRNGGRNPWYGQVDVRASRVFNIPRTPSHRIEFAADIYNFANLLNSEWGGQFDVGNQTLLTVRSFDRATQRFNYQVNENFGVIRKGGDPYRIQLGGRYWF